MGPENSGGPVVVYIDGQPVEIDRPMPEFTIDDVSEDMKNARKILEAWADVCITMEAEMKTAGDWLRSLFKKMELCVALCLASCFKSSKAMANRYLHTKKKRIRKKYEKRILAWFREVFR